MRSVVVLALLAIGSGRAGGQENQPPDQSVPADYILRFRSALQLTELQVTRLQALGSLQTTTISRLTAGFLRAEADLLDASRSDDLVLRRAVLERRARLAIDAEIARLKAEKEAKRVLTREQVTRLESLPWELPVPLKSRVSLWQAIVAPIPLSMIPGDTPDSAEVRVSVTPNHADIFVGNVKMGSGRRVILLPVGRHEIKFFAIGCVATTVVVTVEKGPPVVVPAQKLKCAD